jgi:hypothetical protein
MHSKLPNIHHSFMFEVFGRKQKKEKTQLKGSDTTNILKVKKKQRRLAAKKQQKKILRLSFFKN